MIRAEEVLTIRTDAIGIHWWSTSRGIPVCMTCNHAPGEYGVPGDRACPCVHHGLVGLCA